MQRLYTFAVYMAWLILGFGTACADGGRQAEKEQVVTLLYGDAVFRSKKLRNYFQGQDYAYVTVAYDALYVEQGQRKRVVIVRITPNPATEYYCHSCTPVIGGGVFKWSGNEWVVESRGELVGWGSPFGEVFSLVEIGPDRYGVLDVIEDAHQGYEDKRVRLIVPYRGSFFAALDVGFNEKPGAAACENSTLPEQFAGIRFLPTKTEFFDAAVTLRFNDGVCEKSSVSNQTIPYRFIGGTYKKLGQ